MKKIISMVLSFILILGCSTTAFAAETHNYDTENLPHDGADYFETEIKADEENEERISDFVTVYGYQYTKGSLKSGAWYNVSVSKALYRKEVILGNLAKGSPIFLKK